MSLVEVRGLSSMRRTSSRRERETDVALLPEELYYAREVSLEKRFEYVLRRFVCLFKTLVGGGRRFIVGAAFDHRRPNPPGVGVCLYGAVQRGLLLTVGETDERAVDVRQREQELCLVLAQAHESLHV